MIMWFASLSFSTFIFLLMDGTDAENLKVVLYMFVSDLSLLFVHLVISFARVSVSSLSYIIFK